MVANWGGERGGWLGSRQNWGKIKLLRVILINY
jgi:hypothetical protein